MLKAEFHLVYEMMFYAAAPLPPLQPSEKSIGHHIIIVGQEEIGTKGKTFIL